MKICVVIVLLFLHFFSSPPSPRHILVLFLSSPSFPSSHKALSAPLCLCIFLSSTCLHKQVAVKKGNGVSPRPLLVSSSKSAIPVKSAEAQSASRTGTFALSKIWWYSRFEGNQAGTFPRIKRTRVGKLRGKTDVKWSKTRNETLARCSLNGRCELSAFKKRKKKLVKGLIITASASAQSYYPPLGKRPYQTPGGVLQVSGVGALAMLRGLPK